MIATSDRVFIAGKTGTGKTYAARRLVGSLDRLVVIDSKGMLLDWVEPAPLADQFAARLGRPPARRRLSPPAGQWPHDWYDDQFRQIYEHGNTTLYIDELYAVIPPGKPAPPWLHSLYTRGRERNVGIWAATQRPAHVPLFTLSESEHFLIFRLHLIEDRKRLAAFAGEEVMTPPADRHGFWYYDAAEDAPVYVANIDTEPPAGV